MFAAADMIVKVKEPLDPEVARLRPGPDPVHLPAPRAGAGADARAVRVGRDVHRLRDRRGLARAAAAARADVGDRRAARDAGRRVHAREAARRPRRAARRRPGRRRRERDDHRRRQRRAERGRASRSEWARTCSSSTSRSTACASSRRSSAAAARRCYSSTLAIEELLPRTDLVIGAVLVVGDRAPFVIRRNQLGLMRPGTVLVDVAIDQGGCFETSRPTTHQQPTFEVDGITHYCVTNMPGAVPVTSTHALANATLPYVLALADRGASSGRSRPIPGCAGRQRRRRRADPPGGRPQHRRGVRGCRSGARRGCQLNRRREEWRCARLRTSSTVPSGRRWTARPRRCSTRRPARRSRRRRCRARPTSTSRSRAARRAFDELVADDAGDARDGAAARSPTRSRSTATSSRARRRSTPASRSRRVRATRSP